MFESKIYKNRREKLKKAVAKGLIFFPGNKEVAFNYPANSYPFRQDSNFLYFWGIDLPDLAAIIDCDSGNEIIFGDDPGLEDVIWLGEKPKIAELAIKSGVSNVMSLAKLYNVLEDAIRKNRRIHFAPIYRGENKLWLSELLNIKAEQLNSNASIELIKAIVDLRSTKEECEIAEIEKMLDVAYHMHTAAMKLANPGISELEIRGEIEGTCLKHGNSVSFTSICSVRGETLHNTYYNNILETGQLLLVDAGAESLMHYPSDITRTTPVGKKFDARQREIYEIVLKANMTVTNSAKPGIPYRDMHLLAAKIIANGLKEVGLMKGDIDEAVSEGAHALFFPHGLGHMMGLDVHDMEGLGEDYVGYNDEFKRSNQFGLAYLRMARRLQPGFVVTDEPGIYFIPQLISLWKAEKKFINYINYDNLEAYKNFGGIRIEDDLLITKEGCRVIGTPIPKTIQQIESI
jgi:Xaa-Pro aminopeptidase